MHDALVMCRLKSAHQLHHNQRCLEFRYAMSLVHEVQEVAQLRELHHEIHLLFRLEIFVCPDNVLVPQHSYEELSLNAVVAQECIVETIFCSELDRILLFALLVPDANDQAMNAAAELLLAVVLVRGPQLLGRDEMSGWRALLRVVTREGTSGRRVQAGLRTHIGVPGTPRTAAAVVVSYRWTLSEMLKKAF